jgi:hypothetical protein
MKRSAVAFSLLAAVGGCVSTDPGGPAGGPGPMLHGPNVVVPGPATIPGAMGPGGAPVSVRAPGGDPSGAPSGAAAARQALAQQLPPEIYAQVAYNARNGGDHGLMLAGGPPVTPPVPPPVGAGLSPGGPPAGGLVPFVGPPNGAVAAVGALTGDYAGQFAAARTSVRFVEPRGMKITWMIPSPDGKRLWNDRPLEAPASYNFAQAAIYRLKLTDIPDYPGVDLYPTLEVVPANHRAMTFLAHSSVPVSFTAEDFRMVSSGNYVVKVIYLPDPQYQDIAVGGGLGELISTQLEPGLDPIAEASKRGCILLIARLGNIDLELRHSPAMDAPPPHPPMHAALPPGMMPPGMMPPGMMLPGMGPRTGAPVPSSPAMAPGIPTAGRLMPDASLPPLPPPTNPLTPAQLAGQPTR